LGNPPWRKKGTLKGNSDSGGHTRKQWTRVEKGPLKKHPSFRTRPRKERGLCPRGNLTGSRGNCWTVKTSQDGQGKKTRDSGCRPMGGGGDSQRGLLTDSSTLSSKKGRAQPTASTGMQFPNEGAGADNLDPRNIGGHKKAKDRERGDSGSGDDNMPVHLVKSRVRGNFLRTAWGGGGWKKKPVAKRGKN